ncbi:MAG: bifunctional DNA primase/polymerase [Chloroflexi bacterium]|nr:bifunctional DNA primase/polymerase [Chloroflexota bacterium]
MTTLIEGPTTASHRYPDTHLAVSPVAVITADSGQHSELEIAQAYFSLGERPIPLCDAKHDLVAAWHKNGYQRKDGTVVAPCKSLGKAPLERDYPRFAETAPSAMEIVRMFGSHEGNIGGVVPEGRVVIDIDLRSGGLDSVTALTGRYGPFPETPTVKSGGNGIHNYFLLPDGVTLPSGGSLAASGYPGVEWKGPGGQVVLPPSVHESGQRYLWDPGFAMGEITVAPIPDWLLQLILEQSASTDHLRSHPNESGNVRYEVQPLRAQEHFAGLWDKVGVEVQPGSGDQLYSCPFHIEQHPSMHIDAQRCIWYCFSTECPGHGGGGVRALEAKVGPSRHGVLPAGLVRHVPLQSDTGDASGLGSKPYPNPDAGDADPFLEELKSRAKGLFPLPKGQQPKVISRLCAFTEDPTRLIRHQVISNTWINPVNRAIKRRQLWSHLIHQISVTEVDALYGISISTEEWDDRKRESLAAQVKRRNGQYAAFDNRSVNGHVRFLTTVPILGAAPVEDIDTALSETLRDVDLFEEVEGKQRVHLVWLSKGWSLPAHESKGTVKTIAYKREVEPVDDAKEEQQARQMGLETWQGSESGDLEQWGNPRYFAVPQERLSELGPEGAFDELLELAQRLGYQPVRDVRERLFPNKSDTNDAGQALP